VVVRQQEGRLVGGAIVLLGMIVLGLATFAAMLAFVTFCDRV
jgi:hypothetical protein